MTIQEAILFGKARLAHLQVCRALSRSSKGAWRHAGHVPGDMAKGPNAGAWPSSGSDADVPQMLACTHSEPRSVSS